MFPVTMSLVSHVSEHTGRDLSAVICSLVQCLLDPYCRTVKGFQSLIERECVVMGHKFTDRCGLLANSDNDQCPIFLLFLDCIWQLSEQFPSEFEFSEIYLITLWDSVCLGLFENFIYNSERERLMAMRRFSMNTVASGISNNAPKLMSVWDWGKQFTEEDRSLGRNPLYLTKKELKLKLDKPVTNGASVDLQKLYAKKLSTMYEPVARSNRKELRPVVTAPLMKFWSHCYLRWLTPIQIASGGTPLEYLQQCILVEEIICLQHQKESLENSTPFNKSERRKSRLIFSYNTPVKPNNKLSELLTSSFPFSPGGMPSHVSFMGTPLSLFLENSLIVDSDSDTTQDETGDSEVLDGANGKGEAPSDPPMEAVPFV
jgi:myotubularin-related protein 10/11/12